MNKPFFRSKHQKQNIYITKKKRKEKKIPRSLDILNNPQPLASWISPDIILKFYDNNYNFTLNLARSFFQIILKSEFSHD